MRDWQTLPSYMQNDRVKPYYDYLCHKKGSLFCKRVFDLVVACVLLVILSPLMLLISISIKLDSSGPIFFRQVRVTRYGKEFGIFKFRTMVQNAQDLGSQVSVKGDARITKVGRWLRKLRLDEIPQLLNVICGEMSFVGTRPEVVRYVECYTAEMYATLLLPAGITSKASITYKDEAALLDGAQDVDDTYVHIVLPQKMRYNLDEVSHFSFFGEMVTMIRTVFAVVK